MFSHSLVLHSRAVLILIFAFQAQFISGKPLSVTCKLSFDKLSDSGTSMCSDGGRSHTCETNSCTVPDRNGHEIDLEPLKFPKCWKKEAKYPSGAKATSFRADRARNVIVVYEGKILNSTDDIPTNGLACAWSELRPNCAVCYEI
ncbi:hypothetical protein O181_011463 [Austropuccinia psidii MF-1]|uniref:Secreted protein n=1 Tax=Austropuccinia psidii MF-1 TaxID=1389203 RepID=A0A9Q3BVC2_9BASI|nr:hypothetical protein [Austropuccinia psidii MF-1]